MKAAGFSRHRLAVAAAALRCTRTWEYWGAQSHSMVPDLSACSVRPSWPSPLCQTGSARPD